MIERYDTLHTFSILNIISTFYILSKRIYKMNKNIFTATLFITTLILTPVIISPLSASTQVKQNSLTSSIAKILHKRGLDEDAARKITKEMIGEDDEQFEAMIRNLENGCAVLTQNEILEYLSKKALFKESVALNSYSFLVNMVHSIKNTPLDKQTLKELKTIEQKNSIYA